MSNEVDREESEWKRERERERERERDQICGEKKIIKYKMQMNSNRVNIHGYRRNFGYLDNFGLTDVKKFWTKCVYFVTFCILKSFTKVVVIALRLGKFCIY